MEEISKKHSQVPNNMAQDGLSPREQLVYAVLHSYNNPENKVFPSLNTLAERAQLSIPTIRESLKKLKDSGYIRIEKRGRKNYYFFEKYIKFEPFSEEFLNNKKITATTKAYLVAAQQYMFKDEKGVGKISFSNVDLSKQINMPESSIRKCNNELVKENYLTIIKNKSRDIETGCNTDTKIFNLNELGQAIIWVLKNHEDRITDNENRIANLEKQVEYLLKENSELKSNNKKLENYVM